MAQPFLELLTRRAFPELAAAVRAGYPLIERRWVELVREALPQAEQLTFTQLRDDLPIVMEQVAHALESERPGAVAKLEQISPRHGETRFHQNFNLDEVLIEYNLLRNVVAEEVIARLGRGMTADEAVVLNTTIDISVRQGASAFIEHQTRQLKAATEAQSKYLSFLSHDLRGELNGVFLMIEVLRRELVKEPKFAESLEDLDMMRRSIFQTIGTMDRFLHAERFRKGKVQVQPTDVNLSSLMREIGSQFSYQVKDKGLDLTVEACDACRAVTDKEMVTLILQNLVSNAIKYTQRGAVRLSATAADNNGGGWRLAVADEGPGIAPEKMSELFATFTRGETHGQPGTGLGLSIARQAAELLGARLWAESELGRGATFYLQLPKEPPAPRPPVATAAQ